MNRIFLFTLALFFLFLPNEIFSESLRINKVEFSSTGITKESALRRNIKIEEGKEFESEEELNAYILEIKQQLINARLFAQSDVAYEDGILKVTTVDSSHFLILPFPKYSSNEGFEFKIKFKDNNFLGTMSELSSDVFFKYETKADRDADFVAGVSLKYDHPFSLGKIQASWNNDLSFEYAFIRKEPEWNLMTGLTFLLPFKRSALRLDLTQGFTREADYKAFNDELYWTEDAKFSVPVVLERFEKAGDLTYTPSAEILYKWDIDGISKIDEDLTSPRLIFAHALSVGRVNWHGNFRKGFKASLSQSAAYNFMLNEFQPGVELCLNEYYAWKYGGINSRLKIFAEYDTFRRFTQSIRGVPDDAYFAGAEHNPNGYSGKAAAAIILNIDFPIHIMTIHFEKLKMRALKSFNMEVQLSPFIDIGLEANRASGRVFDLRDGFYTAGIEALIFFEKWKSIQMRISAGFDLSRLLLDKWIDTSWRDSKASKMELTIGIGLFY